MILSYDGGQRSDLHFKVMMSIHVSGDIIDTRHQSRGTYLDDGRHIFLSHVPEMSLAHPRRDRLDHRDQAVDGWRSLHHET